jgi:hypothetical protein
MDSKVVEVTPVEMADVCGQNGIPSLGSER